MGFTEIASESTRQALEDASDENGFLDFSNFVRIALYHPEIGYYQKERRRIGRTAKTDFFTASSFRETFASILLEASQGLLAEAGLDPEETDWVEIGSEPRASLLADEQTPFKRTRALALDERIHLEGQLVVFSNELFDAQPFHSLVFKSDGWQERGFQIDGKGVEPSTRPVDQAFLQSLPSELPRSAPEGYLLDLPTGSMELINGICSQNWKGVFIAFDYGKSWSSLCNETPNGTARAYKNHQQVAIDPTLIGEQDITHHICWDWLEKALENHAFQNASLQSQEAFIVKRATTFMQETIENPSLDSSVKSQLRQLIHPALMGQKFQALTAIRL